MSNWKELATTSLETAKVILRPLSRSDIDGFRQIAFDENIWSYFVFKIQNETDLNAFVEQGIADNASGLRSVYTIIDKVSNSIAGSMCYGNMSERDLRLEIGWSWIGTAHRGTHVNLSSKYALLRHAFEVMDCQRVEFKTDVLNERARRALIKIGATEEGTLRSHTLMPGGRRRDTIYYSVLRTEWPSASERILTLIAQR